MPGTLKRQNGLFDGKRFNVTLYVQCVLCHSEDNKESIEMHCVKIQSWKLTPQVNIESLYFKLMFLNRGSVDLCGSTSYALLSASLIQFKAWVSNLQSAGLVRATNTFLNCLHAKKFHSKLRC